MITRVNFVNGLNTGWQQANIGGGRATVENGILRLNKPPTTTDVYANAQIDDYQTRRRREFRWQPPLTFSIRARFSHEGLSPTAPQTDPSNCLTGTAGFGFWNDPFMMTDSRRPTLPRAIWFFYSSPPSNMHLARDVPGHGWKAATIDAQRAAFYALLPTAPVAIPLMHIKPIYRALWPIAQRAINVSEALISQSTASQPIASQSIASQSMTEWRTYRIDWQPQTAAFFVDDALILECKTPPRGPLGLVIWIDNQYMVVTPQGRIQHGFVCSGKAETLEIAWFQLDQPVRPHS